MPPLESHTLAQQRFHRFLDVNFKCPGCGATADDKGNFYIYDTFCPLEPDVVFSECGVLHKGDTCACEGCGWSGTAQQVYSAAKRKHDWKPCSCCKGTGFEKVKGRK